MRIGVPTEIKTDDYIHNRIDQCHASLHAQARLTGFAKAIEDPGLAEGVNVYKGAIRYKAVAEWQSRPYTPLAQLM